MRHMIVDGRDIMLNDHEREYWVGTGLFKRMPEHDAEDEEYVRMRDKMIAAGDEDFYLSCCPRATVFHELETLGEAQRKKRKLCIHAENLIRALNSEIGSQASYERSQGYDAPSAYLAGLMELRTAFTEQRPVEIVYK